ncbi:Acetylcholinesterase [Halotydeus destructor]|nr:Acetylcholinesterase [Halotydeus destructor]
MVDFGPNKTSANFYVRMAAIFVLFMAFAFAISVLLLLLLPGFDVLGYQMLQPIDDGQSSPSLIQNGAQSGPGEKTARRGPLFWPVFGTSDKKAQDFLTTGSAVPTINVDYIERKPFDPFTGSAITVETQYGGLTGISGHVFGKPVNAFLGVPFAEPPVGELRFRKPSPVKSWSPLVLPANRVRPHCIQHFDPEIVRARHPSTFEMSEDCLYLNIWSPGGATMTADRKLPIMVWIFGGGYAGGSPNLDETDGRAMAALGDVIVVTVNYRVGALGFLDLGSEEIPGNQGLYDNILAIKFIKDTAHTFGGDADQVTLFGQSAGAITIGLLMTNPVSSGLFQRAILQSGSPVMLNFYFSRTEETATNFIASIGCNMEQNGTRDVDSNFLSEASDTETAQRRLDCLLSKSASEVIAAQGPLLKKSFPFTPSPVDLDLLPVMPSEAIKMEPGDDLYNQTFQGVHQVLLGTNEDEASVILHMEMPQVFTHDHINLNISNIGELKDLLISNFSQQFNIEPSKSRLFASMFFNGGPERDSTENLVKRLYHVIGDMAFTCPVTTLADHLARRGKDVYTYQFSQRALASPWGQWMGVPHGDEYLYVFGYPLRYPDKYSGQDVELSKRMVHAWTHFAKTGQMAPQLGTEWPKFDHVGRKYMTLKADRAVIGQNLHDNVCSIFRFGYDSLRRKKRKTGVNYF